MKNTNVGILSDGSRKGNHLLLSLLRRKDRPETFSFLLWELKANRTRLSDLALSERSRKDKTYGMGKSIQKRECLTLHQKSEHQASRLCLGGTNENLVLYLAGNHAKATGKMEKKYYLIEADNLRRGIAYSMNKTIAKMPSIRKQRERQS